MKKILFLLAVSFVALQWNCFASVIIANNQTATIKIVSPGGTTVTVNPGQALPTITDGSTVEILSGNVTVTTTPPSIVNVFTRGNTITLPPNSSVDVSLNTNGAVKVHDSKGRISVTTSDGKITLLKPGMTIVIAGNKVANVEPYQPPGNTPGDGINTQVQIDNNPKDISPVI